VNFVTLPFHVRQHRVSIVMVYCNAVQVDLSALQQQLDTVRQAPAGADIAPSLDAIADLLGQPALPDAAAAAARLVAEVAEGRQASGAPASLQQQHRAGTLYSCCLSVQRLLVC
jgi:hypothetical protein